jgi:AraC-like DNA-binding protein
MMQPDALPVVSLSTQDFEPRQRAAAFAAAAASICKIAIAPTDVESFASQTTIKVLPQAITAQTSHSAARTTRTRAMAADELDNLLIHVPLNHGFAIAQTGSTATECRAGTVYLDPNEVAGQAQFLAPRTDMFYVSIPRNTLDAFPKALNGKLRQVMQISPQWRMFIRYAQSLDAEAADLSLTERVTCCAHLHDLARLALGADEGKALEEQGRGVRAARWRALKEAIETQLFTPGLGLASVAAGQGISERYARQLFCEQQTTFRDYVTRRRLQHVHLMLNDPAQDHRSISDLAMASGFGDLSWFNKCYRDLYGEVPSATRAMAHAR